jgi:hypothetical protein
VRALVSSVGNATPIIPLEILFLSICEHGVEDFACHDASCRPPTSGGTGGSRKRGGTAASGEGTHYTPSGNFVGKAENQADIDRVSGRGGEGSTGTGGLLTEPWLGEDGTVKLNDKQNAAAAKKLNELGTSEAEWTANLAHYAGKSMDTDPAQALRDSKWYTHEHETWGGPLAKEHGITVEQVMAVAASCSTNKQWDGVKSSNKEVTSNILKMLKDDITITITPEQAASYGQFSIDKPSGGGKYGPRTIEAGDYKMSQLSSGVLSRVMGAGYKIGGQYGTDGLYKAFSVARGEITPNQAISSLKQRSFTNNLAKPDVNYSSTNDFWMARAMLGTGVVNLPTIAGIERVPQTVRSWERQGNGTPNSIFGSSGTGSSNLFAVATRSAQNALKTLQSKDKRFDGMKLHEFQALVWVQMQREYGNI